MAFLTKSEMFRKGIKTNGDNVFISDKCSIYGDLIVGNNVRIDDFCTITGNVYLGNNIHIGAYNALYGKMGIIMEDFTGLSPRCTIFSASDNFSGDYLISPMTPDKYTNVWGGVVSMQRYSQIGSGCVIMPNIIISEGSAVGAMSFVNKNIPPFEIWAGTPARFIKQRNKGMIVLANNYKNEL
jgi:galactoside O-acetyltransferase